MSSQSTRITLALTITLVVTVPALLLATDGGCLSVVVGKDASVDGYVIMAHNEDDSAPQIVNHHKIPRKTYDPGEKVILRNGGELDQVEQTWAYIWSEMPGLTFSDSYINEWGVSIASDNCPSREDRPELTDGGINYMLRQLVAQRAKTAREGVLLAGELVERFGYDASGRTYIICDPEEGWHFCAVNGKHWLAERVPDDEVAVIANRYTVHRVDLADTINFLAAPGIIDYALSREWYDPDRDTYFDFAFAFSRPEVYADSSNVCRQWGGLQRISSDPIPIARGLPFSVVPRQKLDISAVMEIMRDHYEDTELYASAPSSGNPHYAGVHTVCNATTQTGFIVQLRRDMPLDIGIVYWVCLGSPCTSCYIPFHFGIPEFPDGWALSGERPTAEAYRNKIEPQTEVDPMEAFWSFKRIQHRVDPIYVEVISDLRKEAAKTERYALDLQESLERSVLPVYASDRESAQRMLLDFSEDVYQNAVKSMSRVVGER